MDFEPSEESKQYSKNRKEHEMKIMRDCFDDARTIIKDEKIRWIPSAKLRIALAFFNKRAGEWK